MGMSTFLHPVLVTYAKAMDNAVMYTDLYELASETGNLLRTQGLRLVTAESCTGGWIGKTITDVPGSSDWFEGGFVTYSNRQLGVDAGILAQYGAVSATVVEAMALGALKYSEAHLAVAVSGIAGPDGGDEAKPVGTVWLAWARVVPEYLQSRCEYFSGDRTDIRYAAVTTALRGVIHILGG